MTDDIVLRLKKDRDKDLFPILEEAAEEIERLRALVTRLAEEGRCRHCTDFPGIWHSDCAWHAWEQDIHGS